MIDLLRRIGRGFVSLTAAVLIVALTVGVAVIGGTLLSVLGTIAGVLGIIFLVAIFINEAIEEHNNKNPQ